MDNGCPNNLRYWLPYILHIPVAVGGYSREGKVHRQSQHYCIVKLGRSERHRTHPYKSSPPYTPDDNKHPRQLLMCIHRQKRTKQLSLVPYTYSSLLLYRRAGGPFRFDGEYQQKPCGILCLGSLSRFGPPFRLSYSRLKYNDT